MMGVVAQSGKIVIDWQADNADPSRFTWSMRCEPGLSVEEIVALCEQMAADHRQLLGEGDGPT
jgi:hypothetical protein